MAATGADPTIRRQVMSAARDVLRKDPGASIDRIARAAGVSRATFYRHFGSRDLLLKSVAHEPRPPARMRILVAVQDMLTSTSLGELSMDQLATAAGVSRGTLYRLFPGKPALLRGLFEAFAPFEAIRAILAAHWEDPPAVVLPLIAREIVGVAGERLGLMRAVFHEAILATPETAAGVRPLFEQTLGPLMSYQAHQMDLGRVRRMDPLLALQSFIGPIFFHLLTRPLISQFLELEVTVPEAVEGLTAVAIAGVAPIVEPH
jgi:AcrR family transcriptional regulator